MDAAEPDFAESSSHRVRQFLASVVRDLDTPTDQLRVDSCIDGVILRPDDDRVRFWIEGFSFAHDRTCEEAVAEGHEQGPTERCLLVVRLAGAGTADLHGLWIAGQALADDLCRAVSYRVGDLDSEADPGILLGMKTKRLEEWARTPDLLGLGCRREYPFVEESVHEGDFRNMPRELEQRVARLLHGWVGGHVGPALELVPPGLKSRRAERFPDGPFQVSIRDDKVSSYEPKTLVGALVRVKH